MSDAPTLSNEFLAIFKLKGEELEAKAKKHVGEQIDHLMKELEKTDKEVKEGVEKFESFLHVDDIVLSGGIKTSEKKKLLTTIGKTVGIVAEGRAKFVKPAADLDKAQDRVKIDPITKIYPKCLDTVNGWENDIPPQIWDERALIKDRVKALTADDQEKGLMKQGAERDIKSLKTDTDKFKQIVGSHSTRSFERTDPFGTKMLSSLNGDEKKELDAMWEKLAKAGQVFLDATVSIDKLGDDDAPGKQEDTRYDFQALYKNITDIGLPEAWWPPRLVERVQAWRKASRVHNQKKAEKPTAAWKQIGGELLGAFGQLMKVGKLGGSIASFEKSFSDDSSGKPEPDKSVERIFMTIGSICEVTDNLKGKSLQVVKGEAKEKISEMLTFDETIDLEDRLDQLFMVVQNPAEFCQQAIEITANIGKIDATGWAKTMDTKVVPGLSLALAIINLAKAIKEAAKSARLTMQTERLRVTSEQQDSSGLRQDGGTTSGSLKKMVGSQQEYTGRQGLKIAVESTNVTGQAVILSGVSAPAGYALTLTATGIELAGEMVFDGIDWGQARVAKKLLKDAQAGSPMAQQLIFEKCVLYATLYLAILVREADPLGKKYIEDRGITQDSLDEPTSIWLLGEAMREAVEKEDDTEIDDNLLMHLGGPLAKVAKRIGNAVVEGGSAIVEKGKQLAASEYDEKWTPDLGEVTQMKRFNPAAWQAIKSDAISDAGLANKKTGVTEGLKALNKVWEEFNELPKNADEKDKLKGISAVLQEAGKVWGLLSGYAPMQGKAPSKAHEPFQAVRDTLIEALNGLVADFKEKTRGMKSVSLQEDQDGNKILDIPKTAWKSIASGGICEAQWTKVWQGAANSIGLDKDDGGVGKVLGEADKAWAAWQELEGQSQIVNAKSGEALYKVRSQAMAAFQQATGALSDASRAVGVFPNLSAFAAAARDDIAKQMRALDDKLCSAGVSLNVGNKPKLPAGKGATSDAMATWAAMWSSSWSQASQEGFCGADGGKGLTDALSGFGEKYAAYLTRDDKDKKGPSKRDEAIHAAAKVLKACDELIQKQPYAPDVILKLAKAYLTDAMAGRKVLIDEVSETEVLDVNDLQLLVASLPGKIPAGGKGLIEPNKLQGHWDKAYQACIDKGVAEKSDSGGKLGKVLGEVEAAMTEANKKLATGKCKVDEVENLYDAMDKIRDKISDAIKLLNKLTAAPGFASNSQILELLNVVGAEFSNYLTVIEDRKGKIELDVDKLDAKQFSKVKNKYIKQGLAPKDKTGLSSLLEALAKAKDKGKAEAIKKLSDQIATTIKAAEDAVAQSKKPPAKGKDKLPELDYTVWINYVKELQKLAV